MNNNNIPLIPRKTFFGNPDRISVHLSPVGNHIAYLAPRDGVLNVWVSPRENLDVARPVTKDTGRGIRFYLWANTNAHILYIQDKNGDQNWRLFVVDLKTDAVKVLTPFEDVQARVQQISPKFPSEILVSINNRNPQFHDIYKVDILTGEMRFLEQNDGFLDYLTDDDYNIRGAERMTPDGGKEMCKPIGNGWELWEKISAEDIITTYAEGFDKSGDVLFMKDSRGRDTSALVSRHLPSGKTTLLAEDSQVDADDLMRHPTEKHVQAVSFIYVRKRWQILDESIEADLTYLHTVTDGEVEVISRTLNDDFWIVSYLVDDGPIQFYLYDRQKRTVQFLFTNRKDLEGQPLAKMHSAIINSRDGLKLVAYYTLPCGTDNNSDGIPNRPLPMVLIPHGGPYGRDFWGYQPWHQWLANRGYAVLCVNFRSSTGFGKAFINSGNFEWGEKIMEDQLDAVRWAVDKGIADADRVAVMGASFGGYSTLGGLTFTPEVFACGVDIVGPSNLITLLESIPPYWKPMFEMLATRIGDPRTEEGRTLLKKHSPLTYSDRICRPLLIGHGANDPRVKQTESDQIVKAMQVKGIPVTYVLYPDEGHGFERPENTLSFFAIAEAFLAKCLGGRCEPIGDDFEGSSLTVPVGVQEVSGLTEALARNR